MMQQVATGNPRLRRVPSIPCPACEGESRITSVTGDGCTRVYRQCYECGYDFKTTRRDGPEVVVEEPDGPAWEQVNAFWQLHWTVLQMEDGPQKRAFKKALARVQVRLGID